MVFYSLYLFNRQGKCLYWFECNKRKSKRNKPEQEQRLLFGLLHSLKSFVNRISPFGLESLENERMHSYVTKGYKLHYFETLSGLRFVLTTDPNVDMLQELLNNVFTLYVEYVVKNPAYTIGDAIDCQTFVNEVTDALKRHPSFY